MSDNLSDSFVESEAMSSITKIIQSLRDQTKSSLYKSWISNDRLNQFHLFKNVLLHKPTFPNTLFETHDDQTIINPYDEKVMSFGDSVSSIRTFNISSSLLSLSSLPSLSSTSTHIEKTPVYFFIYNFTNYFHFLYDTLPYLYGYFFIKEFYYPDLKLLIANPETQTIYKFISDTFELLNISKDDFISIPSDPTIQSNTVYETLFVSTSLTYGQSSDKTSVANNKYSDEASIIWKLLIKNAKVKELNMFAERCSSLHTLTSLKYVSKDSNKYPKRFYVSRRSYIHGDTSNMGTNYTTRRKCINEDEVVEYLESQNIREVFCECYSMEEKILLFSNAELVVGFVGGGMCNLLFSPASTQTICLDTPSFSSINKRFLHSIYHTQYEFYDTVCSLAPHKLEIPLFVRVIMKDSNKIGEIESYTDDDQYLVKLSNNDVAGFALDKEFPTIKVGRSMFETLDNGLNSPFECNLTILKSILKQSDMKEYMKEDDFKEDDFKEDDFKEEKDKSIISHV